MGIVFGVTGVKEPPYRILRQFGNVEIRRYEPYLIAQLNMKNMDNPSSNGFKLLAGYIGVTGPAQNTSTKKTNEKEPMAMTAPVIMSNPEPMAMTAPVFMNNPEPMSMTAPVLTNPSDRLDSEDMAFVLPFEYTKIEDAPVPNDERISIVQIPEEVVAVSTFSGSMNKGVEQEKLAELTEGLKAEGLIEGNGQTATSAATGTHKVAQYHPPFTIPYFRKNEIWMPLRMQHDKVKAMLEKNSEL